MIGKTLRNFHIVSEIGEGGMGVVYLAKHVELPKRFAIKSLSKALSRDANFRKRFYEEAQKQALLDDPNIVQVTDFFEEEGQFFLVMEYVDGQDLSHVIRSRGKLPQSEVLSIFQDILKGLGFAHEKGIVHRDMKPSNVLIDKSGRARIMDFGIAILRGAAEKRLTAVGTPVGTPWYMSPEQIERPHEVDQRTDIYALGIVLYEMLTGNVPFDGETDFSIHYQQVKSPAPDPRQKNSEITDEMAQIVLKAMAKDPSERFQNCSEFRHSIGAIETGKSGAIPKIVIGGLVAMIIASLGTIVYLSMKPRDIVNVITEIDDEKLIEAQRKTAYNLIQSGSKKAWFTCTQLKQLKLKERGSQTAKLIGDTNLEEQIKKQIQDHRKNIDNALAEYSGFLVQLADAKNEIVTQQFDEYTRALGQKESFEQIQIARLMKRHYERYHGGNNSVNAGMMDKGCADVSGKGT